MSVSFLSTGTNEQKDKQMTGNNDKANRILAAIHALDPLSCKYRVKSEEGCASIVERYMSTRWVAICFPHDVDRLTRALVGLVESL